VRYEILGSLKVTNRDESVSISARKMQVVLATLLIRADQVVSTEQLTAEIWGEDRPLRATAALYVYVSQLRKLLSTPGRRESPIVTQAPGYVLRTEPGELDLHMFRRLAGDGRAMMRAGRSEEARAALEQALALWRGPALRELRNGPIINGFVIWLDEMRLECTELLVEANLRLGRHRELVSFLHQLIREHPLHEMFYRQLMLALCRCERRADALSVYRSARETLSTELGLEPGSGLRRLQQAILSAHDDLDLIRPAV
jgi:SARP family transcriptional regulator, regulator of embCAB operon